jgi:hypothetical protein
MDSSPSEESKKALVVKLKQLEFMYIDRPDVHQRIGNLVRAGLSEYLLKPKSEDLLMQLVSEDLRHNQFKLLARFINYWENVDYKTLPSSFFSLDQTVSDYLMTILGADLSSLTIDNTKLVLTLLNFSNELKTVLLNKELEIVLEIVQYFSSNTPYGVISRILRVFADLDSIDADFFKTLLELINQNTQAQLLINLSDSLDFLGGKRVSRMKGSVLAKFLVFLSNWSLPESTLNNIFESLTTMSEERVGLFTKVLGKLTDHSSVALILNKACLLAKTDSKEYLEFCSQVLDRLQDQSSIELFLIKGSDVLKSMAMAQLLFCTEVIKKLDSSVSVSILLSALYQKPRINEHIDSYDIVADLLNSIPEIFESVEASAFSITGLNALSKEDLVKSALSLSQLTLTDLSGLLTNFQQPTQRLNARRAALLAQLQFLDVLEMPALRMHALKQFDYTDQLLFVKFPEALGLISTKADEKVVLSEDRLYLLNRWPELKEILDHALSPESKTEIIKQLLIQGSPGLGKSCLTGAWCQYQAASKSVLWINFRDDQLKVVIMREGYIFIPSHAKIKVTTASDSLFSSNFCTITAIDGVSKKEGSELIKASSSWAEESPKLRQAIGISSLQYDEKALPTFVIPPWQLQEYFDAVKDKRIWDQIKHIFTTCEACKKEFPEISNPINHNLKLRRKVIEWKFKYAGISCRFMFEKTFAGIELQVGRHLDSLTAQENPGIRSEFAINTLFYKKEDGTNGFASQYIAETYAKKGDASADPVDRLNNSKLTTARGQLFEFLSLSVSRDLKEYNIKIHRDSTAGQPGKIITMKSTGTCEYSEIEPPWYLLRDDIKKTVIARNLAKQDTFADADDFSVIFLGKKYSTWGSINKNHAVPRRKQPELPVDQNIQFHQKLGKIYQLDSEKYVRYMNLQKKTHFWVIPKKPTEPAIDAIYVVSKSEVWLIQFTVATDHPINETALRRIERVIRDHFGASVKIKFVFILPNGQNSVTFGEKILKELNISFMVGEVMRRNAQ